MDLFKSIYHKHLSGKEKAWANIRYEDGRMIVKDFNKAFVETLREKFGDLTYDKKDEDVVKLFIDRENIEHEEPRLDVKHSGITEDGRIKMELDWNQSFIRHLADNGIIAETEEEAVQQYLTLIVHNVSDDMLPEHPTRNDVDVAFREIEEQTQQELEIAAQQIADYQITTAKKPRKRKS